MLDPRTLLSLCLLFGLALPGCPGDDDDSAATDDDDSGAGDDDDATGDDDDATGDDDDDDDDSTDPPADYDQATAPDFADCDPAQNQFKVMLGDGSVIGPFSGFSPAPASFSNNAGGSWALRMGTAATFSQLQGNRTGYVADAPVTMQGPAATAGNLVNNVLIGAGDLAGAPAATSGGYGLPALNADARVGGTVTFTTLPEPGSTAAGTFGAVLQNQQQLNMGNTVLLGITGCFSAPLTATD